MIGRNLRYLVALAVCALLPLAGCSGGGSATKLTEKGTEVTVSGKVDVSKAAAKTAFLSATSAGAANNVFVYNAQDGAQLGTAAIGTDGAFSNLTFTLPATKTILVFKAIVAQGTFRNVVPIDLSTPPAAGAITAGNPISIEISQDTTARTVLVSQLLGLSGTLGDANQTLASVEKTYTDAAAAVVNNGGQQLAYSSGNLLLSGKFSSAALLPAQDANALNAVDIQAIKFEGAVTSVAIPGNKPIVSFQVTNAATKKGIKGLKSFGLVLAQLKPEANGLPNEWLSYMTTGATRPGTDSGYSVIDNGDGSYTAIFGKDIKNGTGGTVPYNAAYTHRVMVQVYSANSITTDVDGQVVNPVRNRTTQVITGSSFTNALTFGKDFVPDGSAVVEKRDVTTTEACNECHTKIGVTTPHAGRISTEFCVVCHTAQRGNGKDNVLSVAGAFDVTVDQRKGDGEVFGEFVTMVHKIHMGSKLTKTGYNYDDLLFNDIEYPVWNSVANCRKCHKDGAAPQGNNWQTKPSRKGCGSCHDNINFATGANLKAGGAAHAPQADDSFCVGCHGVSGPYPVEKFHRTNNATANNPVAKAGLYKIEYEISGVTVNDSNQPVVTFRILKDGVPAVFNTYAGTTVLEEKNFLLLTGFTGSPSFLVAYADGTQSTIDYNNLGKSAAQPASVSIAELAVGAAGTLAATGTDGYYVATINNTVSRNSTTGVRDATKEVSATFPAGSKLRTVALQGYFTQPSGTNGITANTGRYAISAVKSVTGEERREIVDSVKCANCHEYILAHGSNRVYNAQVCSLCHNPNLSSSGKTLDLTVPEATQNLRDMVHAIHAGAFRTTAYTHYRNFNGNNRPYDWSFVKFPGILSDCLMCHKPGTYGAVPDGALVTTDVTTDGTNATTAAVTAARTSVPNATDMVTTPFTATCVGCHDGFAAKAHMGQNGGSILQTRSALQGAEACAVCHGPDRAGTYHK